MPGGSPMTVVFSDMRSATPRTMNELPRRVRPLIPDTAPISSATLAPESATRLSLSPLPRNNGGEGNAGVTHPRVQALARHLVDEAGDGRVLDIVLVDDGKAGLDP